MLITTAVTGLFAAWVLKLSWLEGLLIGAIVGSTDAAAVFALPSGRGLEINRRVGSALEIESGSNDPMAVFLTSALIGVLGQQGQDAGVAAMLWLFVKQMGLGALAGWGGGKAMVWLFQRLGARRDAGAVQPGHRRRAVQPDHGGRRQRLPRHLPGWHRGG